MSLLDNPPPDCSAAVDMIVAELAAGSMEDRAILLNLREEDRVPESKRAAFHRALSVCTGGRTAERIRDASRAAQLALPVAGPQRTAIKGAWSTYVTLSTLQKYRYLSSVTLPGATPPPRLRLARPIGRPEHGADLFFWVTPAQGHDADELRRDADELRDRLGLCHVSQAEQLYGIQVGMDTAPDRPLHIPTALDAGVNPAWRRPDRSHTAPWGISRDLRNDEATEPELLAHPHDQDGLQASHVGTTRRSPAKGYLARRPL